ncbi:MAG: 50S ribosomal protein L4 [Ardenticatenia bacterium]|nr:50S ribosomal protein L4 [Ardenticatenia bacterium]
MKVAVYNMQGEQVDEVELAPNIFEVEPNIPVMHQALVRQLANKRQGTHSTKTRAEVARTGRKVWRQKGTGRARQGSRRAPHWVGGGVAFGPKPRDYTQQMPRKMRRLAIRSALAAKAQGKRIVIVDRLELERPQTREMAALLERLGLAGHSVVVLTGVNGDEHVKRSARNLPDVRTLHWRYLNVRDLLGHDYLLMPLEALRQIEALWG